MQEHNEVLYCIRDRRDWGYEFTRKCLHITFFKPKKYNEASFCEFVLLILDNLFIYILVYSCKTFTYFNKAWYIRKLISFFLISGHEATHYELQSWMACKFISCSSWLVSHWFALLNHSISTVFDFCEMLLNTQTLICWMRVSHSVAP